MAKIVEKIKNLFTGKFTCKPKKEQETKQQEEPKTEEKPKEQK